MSQVSVVLNSFNYGRYVVEAIESALDQSRAPAEVIVVDDGSTDDTRQILESRYANHPSVKVCHQRNGGQMSAFVSGMDLASGDILCFLDADDLFERGHVEQVAQAFDCHPDADFVFTAHRRFGGADDLDQPAPIDLDLGFSLVSTLEWRRFIGSATSTIAIRRGLAETLLPVFRTVAPRWRIRADDCLVYGASIAGGKKQYLAEPTVRYRVHGRNGHFKQPESRSQSFAHRVRRDAFVELICAHIGMAKKPPLEYVLEEFVSIQRPTHDQYRDYARLILSPWRPSLYRLKTFVKIHRHYSRNKPDW